MLPAAIVVPALAAVVMERVAFRPVRGASVTTTLVTSFAVAIVVQNLILIKFGARPHAIPFPDWVTSNVVVGSYDIQVLQFLSAGVTGVALIALVLFLRRTKIGISMRAAADDFEVTRLMGIRTNRVIAGAFALSGIMAGAVGVLWVARRGTVDPLMGTTPVLKAFIAAVIGGLGSLPGAVVGGYLLGIIEVTLEASLPAYPLRFEDAFAFGFVVLILLARPEGILRRRAESA
jgi:branched-chain amino acid transport system permease protein